MDIKRTGTFKKEYNRLNRIFKNINPDKRELIDGLLHAAAFSLSEMEKCMIDIQEIGSVYNFKNGKQEMLRKNPSFEVYKSYHSQYLNTMKELRGYIDVDDDVKGGGNTLKEFDFQVNNVREQKLRAVK